ncbi:MAG: helix-turn-helix domain-containing protein [Lachnospiraceae bacterium]|nr:helix-turn-helix domain-containing protein [Lachnospiraceae bacterium]
MVDKLLLVEDVCKYLKLGKSTVYKLIKSGELSAAKIRGHYLINISDVEKFINGNKTAKKKKHK